LSDIEDWFPGLSGTGYRVTSPENVRYNCIAWARDDTEKWWWPPGRRPLPGGTYWPPDAPTEPTLVSFISAFRLFEYEQCESLEIEEGYEKVALYAHVGSGEPTHAARQLPSGAWTSKLGRSLDLEHSSVDGLEGDLYGRVAVVLRRPRLPEG